MRKHSLIVLCAFGMSFHPTFAVFGVVRHVVTGSCLGAGVYAANIAVGAQLARTCENLRHEHPATTLHRGVIASQQSLTSAFHHFADINGGINHDALRSYKQMACNTCRTVAHAIEQHDSHAYVATMQEYLNNGYDYCKTYSPQVGDSMQKHPQWTATGLQVLANYGVHRFCVRNAPKSFKVPYFLCHALGTYVGGSIFAHAQHNEKQNHEASENAASGNAQDNTNHTDTPKPLMSANRRHIVPTILAVFA